MNSPIHQLAALALLLFLLPAPLPARSEEQKQAITPDAGAAGEDSAVEEEIVIRKKGENTIEEYRINGRLFKVKITPGVGPAYYLTDTDGDGFMDTRNDLKQDPPVPQWVLFSW